MGGDTIPFDPERYTTENGHFDETAKYSARLITFLRDSFPSDGAIRHPKYDQIEGIHSSGGSKGFELLFGSNPEFDFITVTKQLGEITGIHARLKGSNDDFYLSSEALTDFLVDKET